MEPDLKDILISSEVDLEELFLSVVSYAYCSILTWDGSEYNSMHLLI